MRRLLYSQGALILMLLERRPTKDVVRHGTGVNEFTNIGSVGRTHTVPDLLRVNVASASVAVRRMKLRQ